MQLRAFPQGGNMQIGIHDFHFVIHADIGGGQFAGTHCVYLKHFGLIRIQLHRQLLEVEDDFRHILFHAGHG